MVPIFTWTPMCRKLINKRFDYKCRSTFQSKVIYSIGLITYRKQTYTFHTRTRQQCIYPSSVVKSGPLPTHKDACDGSKFDQRKVIFKQGKKRFSIGSFIFYIVAAVSPLQKWPMAPYIEYTIDYNISRFF